MLELKLIMLASISRYNAWEEFLFELASAGVWALSIRTILVISPSMFIGATCIFPQVTILSCGDELCDISCRRSWSFVHNQGRTCIIRRSVSERRILLAITKVKTMATISAVVSLLVFICQVMNHVVTPVFAGYYSDVSRLWFQNRSTRKSCIAKDYRFSSIQIR